MVAMVNNMAARSDISAVLGHITHLFKPLTHGYSKKEITYGSVCMYLSLFDVNRVYRVKVDFFKALRLCRWSFYILIKSRVKEPGSRHFTPSPIVHHFSTAANALEGSVELALVV